MGGEERRREEDGTVRGLKRRTQQSETKKERKEERKKEGRRTMNEVMDTVVNPMKTFAKDSIRPVNKCTKPDRKEYSKIAFRTILGFVIMGFIGFFVKLIFIPINQII